MACSKRARPCWLRAGIIERPATIAAMAFAPLANDTFLRACLRQATPYTPVWLMRQAGRYLPEYHATRARAGSFMGLATNVDYATEVTLQPLERFALDAAILFSDILTVPDAMGLGLSFAEGEGPSSRAPLRDEAAVARAGGARPGQAALRVRRRHVDPPRAERPRAADRLFRQPLDAGLLHGRRRRLLGRLARRQEHAVQPARPDAPHPGGQRRRRGRLPQRADRRRRAGRDDLRQLGRRAGRRRLPGIQPGLHARACWPSSSASHDGATDPAHRLHQGRRPVAATRWASSTATCWASTGR